MSDNIEVSATGQATFVSAREDAWHHLGTVLPDTFTAEEAMRVGHLGGWNVRKAPVFTRDDQGNELAMPGRHAVLRDNPFTAGQVDVLGNVGAAYTPIQNEAHADLLNALVDESGAHFETAGAIDGGRKVFVTMKLPGHMRVGGVDQVDNYIAAVNSHDGSSAFTLLVTPVRIVCQNTLNLAMGQARSTFRVRHTSGATKGIVHEARQALDMTFAYLDGFQEQADRMINTAMTQRAFEKLIYREFGPAEDAAENTVSRTENKLNEMVRLFAEAPTQEGIRGTAWAGLNAMTEWADHYSPTRGNERDTARHAKAVLDPAWKNRALALMMTQVS